MQGLQECPVRLPLVDRGEDDPVNPVIRKSCQLLALRPGIPAVQRNVDAVAAGICLRADRREHLGKIAVLHVQHDDTDVVRLSLSQSGGKEIRPVAVFLCHLKDHLLCLRLNPPGSI